MAKEPLESRLSRMFEKYKWKAVIKLEGKNTKCCESARQKIIKYLISSNYISYTPKGHYGICPLDSPEHITDAEGNEIYFVSRGHASDYAIGKYAPKDKNDPGYGKLPTGIFIKEIEPAAA